VNILVPQVLFDYYVPDARLIAPNAEFIAYADDEPSPAGLADIEAISWWYTVRHIDDIVRGAPKLRWLHSGSAGVDRLLSPTIVSRQGLTVTDSGPAFEVSISEFVMAWILSVARRLPELDAQQRDRVWNSLQQDEVSGKTVGIIGLGPIGRGVAARTKAFGMRTLGLRRSQAPVDAVDEVLTGRDGLTRLLSTSDYVVIAAALTGETRTLIGREQLAAMKSTAWLINIARGAMIDETALVEALRSGKIAGACLDVFETEPLPQDSLLWEMSNVHIAPHNSGGMTEGVRERQKQLFLDNLRRFVSGEPLADVVDVARGY